MRRHEFINEEIVQEIIQFIRSEKNREALLSHLDDYHDYDIAQALEELTPEERRARKEWAQSGQQRFSPTMTSRKP